MNTFNTDDLPAYAELHCRSNFSFLQGASHPKELVDRAIALGYRALALTDECSVAGVVRAHEAVKEAVKNSGHRDFQLLVGSELLLRSANGTPWCSLLAIAQHREGYGNLCELITLGRMRSAKGEYRLHIADLDAPARPQAHLRGLPGCWALLVPDRRASAEHLAQQALWLARTFGERARIAVELLHEPGDDLLLERLLAASHKSSVALVAAGAVVMHVRSRKPLHDTVTAIRLNRPIAQCGHALASNAEQHLRARARLARLYRHEWLAQTVALAEGCHFSLDELRYEYPQEIVPEGHTPGSWLRTLTTQGAARRYAQGVPDKVSALIDKELALIAELGYEAFFLTIADIVDWARSRNILCQGRGSAANSAVCYCLHITEVDPASGNLLFERFVSRERQEPPDIDVDFEHQRREEVIQYIYNKYGRDRTAIAATVVCYRSRSVLREVGRALGIDESRIDTVAKNRQWWDAPQMKARLFAEQGLDVNSPTVQQWLELTTALHGFPRHLSQHVGGFVISRDKLSRLVPIENAAMEDRSVIQWDKDDLESLRLIKVDVLALGMLSALHRALNLLTDKLGSAHPLRLQDIPREDPATYQMIQRADTVGVFQIESRAQMSMLPRLKPQRLYDLVVEVAIVRPGPIVGGMVHPYLKRKRELEGRRDGPTDPSLNKEIYPKEELKAALERTLGVPIFQEQVMQIAIIAAEFTPGEADQLRRAMAAWQKKGGIGHFEERLVGRMVERGYTPEFAKRVFEQAKGFGEYGFPESHAWGFALLAYFSSWIKCHHPDVFLAALLNSQPMGFYGPSQLVQDAQRHGVTVRPVDVANSHWDCTLERPEQALPEATPWYVRLGLNRLSGFNPDAAQRIMTERTRAPFANVEDLARRCALNRQELTALAAGNALAALAGHRRQARWDVAGIQPLPGLLGESRMNETPLVLNPPRESEEIVADYTSLHLTLGRHPLALLRAQLAARRIQTVQQLHQRRDGQRVSACGLVTVRQRPGTASGVMFMTLEDETGSFNVIVWPKLLITQRKELLRSQLLTVHGVWQDREGVQNLVAQRVQDDTPLLGPLASASRDFH